MNKLRSRLTFANVVSMIALFIALGGTGYAAAKLPRNSVGTQQLKSNAVTGAKVKNGALSPADFKAGSLPSGPAGANGANGKDGKNGVDGRNGADGKDGKDGTAVGYARVGADGTLDPGAPPQNKNVVQANVQHQDSGAPSSTNTGVGVYCFGGLPFEVHNAVVTAGNADTFGSGEFDRFATVAVQRGQNLGRCDAAHQQVRVVMVDKDGTLQNHPFYVWFTN
jgi:hypothetical protein